MPKNLTRDVQHPKTAGGSGCHSTYYIIVIVSHCYVRTFVSESRKTTDRGRDHEIRSIS